MEKLKALLKEARKYARVALIARPAYNLKGCYYPVSKVIHIKKTMNDSNKLYVLAHEFGHAVYGHDTMDVDQAIADERAANTFAVKLAKQYDFYTSAFKAYIKQQRRAIKTKWYRAWLIDLGFKDHLKKKSKKV